MLAAAIIHIVASVQLVLRSNKARAQGYKRYDSLTFSYASRTMRWGGVIILLFVIYHLMHFTWGNAHPDFVHGDAYHNFVIGFSSWPVALAYIAAMIPLGIPMSSENTMAAAASSSEFGSRRALRVNLQRQRRMLEDRRQQLLAVDVRVLRHVAEPIRHVRLL